MGKYFFIPTILLILGKLKNVNSNKKQIWSMLGYLKESGLPCDVFLKCNDYPKYDYGYIDLNDLSNKELQDDFDKIRCYVLIIKVVGQKFCLWNNKPHSNQWYINNIKELIPEEYLINNKRKKVLDDIFN
ncbi:MAG: hypothetical protein WCR72_18625 [Bacteroidota bacterium]